MRTEGNWRTRMESDDCDTSRRDVSLLTLADAIAMEERKQATPRPRGSRPAKPAPEADHSESRVGPNAPAPIPNPASPKPPESRPLADEATSKPARSLTGWLGRWRRTAATNPAPRTTQAIAVPLPALDTHAAAPVAPAPPVARPATPPIATRDDHRETAPLPFDSSDDDRWRPLIDPMKVMGGIARSKLLIVLATLIGAGIGVAMALATPKTYEAAAELLVDPRDLNLVDRELTQSGLASDASLALVENRVRVLTSGGVLNKVVDELHLELDPEFNGQGEAGIGNPLSMLRALLSNSDGDADPNRARSLAVGNLAQSLSVSRSGKTFVIVVEAATRDGEKSALIANTTVDVFLNTFGSIQSDTAGRAADELTSRLDELRQGLEEAERAVETFKSENDIIDAQGRLITDDEIVRLNEQLGVARARTLELNARAASARSVDLDDIVGGSLPEEVASNVMTELRSQFAVLKSESDRLAVRLGPRHPQRQAAEAQLAGARDQLAAELRRVVATVQTELKRAVQLEQELASRLAQLKVRQGSLSGEMVTLRQLEREATAKREVYEAFLLRARETGEQRGLNTANMSVISEATPPLEASGPSRSAIALTGAMLGFLGGVGLGGARGAFRSLRESRTAPRPTFRPAPPPLSQTTSMAVVPLEPIAPKVSVPPEPDPAASTSAQIEEIRESLRDFREAVRELTEARANRRYF